MRSIPCTPRDRIAGRPLAEHRSYLRIWRNRSAAPATMEARLAACAFVKPKNERGLMRMNSTRNRAVPVSTKYAANTSPRNGHTLSNFNRKRSRCENDSRGWGMRPRCHLEFRARARGFFGREVLACRARRSAVHRSRIHLARAHPPQPPRNRASRDQFVNRRGVNSLGGGHKPVWKTHPPRQGRRDAVIPVARQQATDASYAVAQRGGR